jgi:hypothetical protein
MPRQDAVLFIAALMPPSSSSHHRFRTPRQDATHPVAVPPALTLPSPVSRRNAVHSRFSSRSHTWSCAVGRRLISLQALPDVAAGPRPHYRRSAAVHAALLVAASLVLTPRSRCPQPHPESRTSLPLPRPRNLLPGPQQLMPDTAERT